MKTFIIATILSVGVLLRPEMTPALNDAQTHPQLATIGIAGGNQSGAKILDKIEMNDIQGAGIIQCSQVLDVSGDIYFSCCINLWLFRLCAEVNWSAIERFLPF